MKFVGLIVMFLGFVSACDGTNDAIHANGSDAHVDQANDAAADAGRFACGNTLCEATQICLYPPYGCIAFSAADGGACPAGTHISDAGTDCLQDPPAPSCVTPAAGSGSYDCSQGGGDSCNTVNAPIPASCGHVCRDICI